MSAFQYYKDKAGEWRWRLRANNHEIIAASGEGYKNKQDCLHAVDLIKTLSPEAEIRIYSSDDQYIVYSKKAHVSQEAKDEVVVPTVETFTPLTRPEKERSKLWLWAIPAVLLLLILIFLSWSSDQPTEILPDDTELAQQDPVESVAEQTPAVLPSATIQSEIEAVAPAVTNGIPPASHKIEPGDNLWRLAQLHYGDGHLWPVIYKANMLKISHPDILSPGITLDIPGFDGTLSSFTQADSSKIAVASIQAYLAYRSHDNADAKNYLWVANMFDADAVFEVESQVDASDLLYATQ